MKGSWLNKFDVVGIIPGKIVLSGIGTLDLSDKKLSIDRVQAAYDAGCPYLKLKPSKVSDSATSHDKPDNAEIPSVEKANADEVNEKKGKSHSKKIPS